MREVIEALLEADAHDKSFFGSRESLDALALAADHADVDRHACSPTRKTRCSAWRSRIARTATRGSTQSRCDFVTAPDYRHAAEQLPRDSRHQAADDGGVDRRGRRHGGDAPEGAEGRLKPERRRRKRRCGGA